MNHDAFVSYASTDRVVAYKMVDYLESCGIRCWVAPRDVPGGRNYAEAILSALVESKLFLLIFSESSNGSEHVQREVERALHLSKTIVPVRIKDVLPSGAMDYYLATLHWIDAFAPGGDDSDVHGELGREDAARAAAAILGKNDEVRDAIAEIHRDKKDAEERRVAAELQARLQAEADAKAKTAAAAEAESRRVAEAEAREKAEQEAEQEAERLRIEREQKRQLEIEAKQERKQAAAEEKKRLKAEQKQQDKERRKLEAELATEARLQAREKAKADSALAAAEAERIKLANEALRSSSNGEAVAASGASTKQLVTIAISLVVFLVGIGFWASRHFEMPERKIVEKPPEAELPPVVETPAIAHLEAYFEWAGERRKVAFTELLNLDADDPALLSGIERDGDKLDITLPGSSDQFGVDVALSMRGFEPVKKRLTISDGEVIVEFGPLTRLTGDVTVRSDYSDQPRAVEAHRPFLKMVHIVWQSGPIDADRTTATSSAATAWVDEIHDEAVPEVWQTSPIGEAEITAKLPAGRYRAILVTDCSAPFDEIQLSEIEVSPLAESPPLVTVPIVPLGVFGGDTAWTSTTTEASRDEDGTVAWTLYNLPAALDFAGKGPRLVQSYTDIVNDGQLLKKYFLPAAVTEVTFDPGQQRWHLLADPTSVVSSLRNDDLTDRYFEKLDFYLSYHGDKRGILFDVETVDQPLNATEGTKRAFTLQNAYPSFSEAIADLDTRYPGFGVLDLNKVFVNLNSWDEDNAAAYRRSATIATSMATPVPVDLGIEPDLSFAGSGNVRLEKVRSGGAGEEAGLKPGDLVVSLGGAPVEDLASYYRIRFGLGDGIATEIQVLREGLVKTLVITPRASQ